MNATLVRNFSGISAALTVCAISITSSHAASSPIFLLLQPGTVRIVTGAAEITSVLDTINGGFFSQNNVFAGSAPRTVTDQTGGGVWVRSTGGSFNTTVPGTIQVPGTGSGSTPLHTSSDFTGVQAGVDLARYDIGGSVYTVNFGLTGGKVSVQSRGYSGASTSKDSANFEVPFIGAYAAIAGHGFFADALFREDFIEVTTDPGALQTTLPSSTFAASAGYRYDVGQAFFVVPSAAISVTSLDGKSFAVPPSSSTAAGIARLGSIDSELGRVGLTVGHDFVTPQFLLSPFVTGTVFNEFAGSSKLSYSNMDPTTQAGAQGLTSTGSIGRIGTFEQFSAGMNASLRETGLVSFVRGDIRTGDRVDGFSVSGGMRYSF